MLKVKWKQHCGNVSLMGENDIRRWWKLPLKIDSNNGEEQREL